MKQPPVKLIGLPAPPPPPKRPKRPGEFLSEKFRPPSVRRVKVGAGLTREEVVEKLKELDPWRYDSFYYDGDQGIATLLTVPEKPEGGS